MADDDKVGFIAPNAAFCFGPEDSVGLAPDKSEGL